MQGKGCKCVDHDQQQLCITVVMVKVARVACVRVNVT